MEGVDWGESFECSDESNSEDTFEEDDGDIDQPAQAMSGLKIL